MTIYTLGDPDLLREVLLALSTIFGLLEWSNPANPMGIGGNFLAVALVGLIAVAISGVSTQEVRVDLILVSLVLFGLAFGTKVNVNVEDIQTGEAATVNGIPLGVAAVGSASSSVARSLTETMGTSLQRPGAVTSVITQGGFLDPLKILTSLRHATIRDLDEHLERSLLDYYKNCVGGTLDSGSNQFSQDTYRSTPDPVSYLLGVANILDLSTQYYDDANPGGVTQGCHATGGQIRTQLETLATSPSLEGYMARAMGNQNYNDGFDISDIEDAATITTRGGVNAQEFMSRLFLRNFHNSGEAWRLAAYGTDQAQYAASLTDAFETQRSAASTQGTVFLQFMLPLMSFFQFLFFSLAPIIALVMVASPFSSMKILGSYLLLGVWAYSWLPIAAVINHYMEISTQNMWENSGLGAFNTGYTAISGFDDFYNNLATRLAIGSNALASVPVITATLLSGAIFGISSGLGKLGQAGGGAGAGGNTGYTAPSVAQNAPVNSIGGRASSATGTVISGDGVQFLATPQETDAFGSLNFGARAENLRQSAATQTTRAQSALSASRKTSIDALSEVSQNHSAGSTFEQSVSAATHSSIQQGLRQIGRHDIADSLTTADSQSVAGQLGLGFFGSGASESSATTSVDGRSISDIATLLKDKSAGIGAEITSAVENHDALTQNDSAKLSAATSDNRQKEESFQKATESARQKTEAAANLSSVGFNDTVALTDIAKYANAKGISIGDLQSYYQGEHGSTEANRATAAGLKEQRDRRPLSIDGKSGGGGAAISGFLKGLANDLGSGNPEAANRLSGAVKFLSGIGTDIKSSAGHASEVDKSIAETGSTIARNDGVVDQAGGQLKDSRTGIADIVQGFDGEKAVDQAGQTGISSAKANTALSEIAEGDLANKFTDAQNLQIGRNQSGDREGKGSRGIVNAIRPGAGATPQLISELGPLLNSSGSAGETRALALQAIGRLERQYSDQGGDGRLIGQAFEAFRQGGFSDTEAALATYGAAGSRTPGATDLFVAGVFSAAGVAAGEKSVKTGSSFFTKLAKRGGGAVVGGALFASGVIAAQSDAQVDATQNAQQLGSYLKDNFKKVNPGDYEEFAGLIDQQTSAEGVTSVLQEFYQTGKITDSHLDHLDQTKANADQQQRDGRNPNNYSGSIAGP